MATAPLIQTARPSTKTRHFTGTSLDTEVASFRGSFTPSVDKLSRSRDGRRAVQAILIELLDRVSSAVPATSRMSAAESSARKTGAFRRSALLEEHGGTISADDAGRLLGLSKQAVIDRVKRGQLLALRAIKQNAYRFPVFQFDLENAVLVPGIEDVLRELNAEPSLDAWAKCNFLLSPRDSLGSAPPLALLNRGQAKKVVALARAYAMNKPSRG